jgi:hypothetical protein
MESQTKAVEVAKPRTRRIAPVSGDETSNFIQLAIQNNASIEVMERLYALKERVSADKARAAFVTAMANFQSECPIIEKTKKVLDYQGKLRYEYAPLDAIISQIKKPLAANRLAYRWNVEETVEGTTKYINATAIITHEAGHSESSSFKVPIVAQLTKDGRETMTKPQQNGSALTFAKRYALCNVLGIATGEEDNDANTVNNEPKPKSDRSKIAFLLRDLGYRPQSQKEYAKVIGKLVELKLTEENIPEIVARLEVLIAEKNNDNAKVQ